MANVLPEYSKEKVSLETFNNTFFKLKEFLTLEDNECPKTVLKWLDQVFIKIFKIFLFIFIFQLFKL